MTPGGSDWLEGHVSRVLYVSEQSGYVVMKLAVGGGQEVPVVGTLGALVEQQEDRTFVALEGRWETHSVHGRQFRAVGYLTGTPRTIQGLKLYLAASGIPGVGKKTAERVVGHFGMETLSVLSKHPARLAEVQGIGPAKAEAIAVRWAEEEEGRALTIALRGLGLHGGVIERIRRRWPEQAGEVVAREPYRLAEEIRGVGFRTADLIARRQGVRLDDPGRVRAAVGHVLERESGEGHCFLSRDPLKDALALLEVPRDGVDTAVSEAEGRGHVVVDDLDRIYTAPLYAAERLVAMELGERCQVQESLTFDTSLVAKAMGYEGVELDEDQQAAVRSALDGGVTVITGGPGTGKTTLVRILLRAARERGEEWLLASPTGRASKRLEEATGMSASTLHRLLEYNPGEGGFQKGMSNPLEADGLVVDEVSMVDLPLMEALVRSLPRARRFSLVLVGDADQLPSVGPGQILRDLIDSGVVRTSRLTRVHRQAQESGIVKAAAAILLGSVPPSGELAGWSDYYCISRDDAVHAQQTLLTVVSERLPGKGFAPDDVQVLAPTRKGPLGTQLLNKLLQERLNPDGDVFRVGQRAFRVGDRVICTKNRYDVEIFNGDIGRVVRIDAGRLVVQFDTQEVAWSTEELHMLELAYAITVHKSQGSEYPAVVFALHGSHGIMLRRNLFYTGVTRAKRFLCVVGNRKGWFRAATVVDGRARNTGLADRLRKEAS